MRKSFRIAKIAQQSSTTKNNVVKPPKNVVTPVKTQTPNKPQDNNAGNGTNNNANTSTPNNNQNTTTPNTNNPANNNQSGQDQSDTNKPDQNKTASYYLNNDCLCNDLLDKTVLVKTDSGFSIATISNKQDYLGLVKAGATSFFEMTSSKTSNFRLPLKVNSKKEAISIYPYLSDKLSQLGINAVLAKFNHSYLLKCSIDNVDTDWLYSRISKLAKYIDPKELIVGKTKLAKNSLNEGYSEVILEVQ